MMYSRLLDDVEGWFGRFVAVPDDADLSLLTLWAVHTHLALECYTSPRLLIDSTMPGSGKTTVLDHLSRLCHDPVQAASLSSAAMLARILDGGIRTILIDETDRSLSPDKPGVGDLIAILNSGYRRGATRPVLVPDKESGWITKEMDTYAPVAMAGNSPRLPDDTRSRCLRVLLMPDVTGKVEDSDWEFIESEAEELRDRIAVFADEVRDSLPREVTLPEGCRGRAKEKWRPLKRVAVAAGGHWPAIADELAQRGLAEDAAEHEAGLLHEPPGMVILRDLAAVWPHPESFVPTELLVSKLVVHSPEYWGVLSNYGKALTAHRLGRLVAQASKVTSTRPGGRGPRGYALTSLDPVWRRLGIPPKTSGATGDTGGSGATTAPVSPDHPLAPVQKRGSGEPEQTRIEVTP